MKKGFVFVILLCLVLLLSFNIAYASYSNLLGLVTDLITTISSSSAKNFGGTITKDKVEKIKTWEEDGYTCTPSGKSITVKSKTGTIDYFIPSGTKNNNSISKNKQILGKYSGTKKIECTETCKEGDVEYKCTQSIKLNKVTYYGT